jgi:glycosyltransferase involved in cell wall biosynthesis
VERDPFKVIYSSNPDRGLAILMEMWEDISREVPGIKLEIYYGYEGLKSWGKTKEWQESVERQYNDMMERIAGFANITFKGGLPKKQLALEMLSASLCLYPNNFWETFCLTALETQAAGVPMITTDKGALATTLNQTCNILIRADNFGEAYKARFIRETVRLLQDPGRLSLYSTLCREHVLKGKTDWSDTAALWDDLMLGH